MPDLRLPERRVDGSFMVRIWFATSDLGALALMRDYLAAWLRAHPTWVRIWRSDAIHEEDLEFTTDFLAGPRLEVGPEENLFAVVLEARPLTLRWREWAEFLAEDLLRVFPELTLEGFEP